MDEHQMPGKPEKTPLEMTLLDQCVAGLHLVAVVTLLR
jgi:hypothetical protein